ncbi:MAG TPA: histidine kinase N-terminal domain-containing protein [Propionibacteriaceae bacterium]
MPSMSEVIADHTDLTDGDHLWLKLVVSEWQLLADLSFSDLVLWVRDRDVNVFWAAAQVRPTTAPTAMLDDVVGDLIAYSPEHLVADAFVSGSITQTSEGSLHAGMPVDTRALPVKVGQQVLAVIEQHTSQLGVRSPSSLEISYLKSAAELAQMITAGTFPIRGDDANPALSPRVGDGYIRLDPDGVIEYASPNALSAYRRLGLIGDLVSEHLATLTAELLPTQSDPIDESVESVLTGRTARRAELVSGDAHLLLRAVPLLQGRHRLGTIVLSRDVSDLRSRERELVTKDATIREIHHRVKNNLQTVAALLRMQARRTTSPEAKLALTDATSRVAAIAIVHETLSQTFDEVVEFDRVADGLLRMVGDVAATTSAVNAKRVGSFGVVSAGVATSLSMVITELCQNAVEHGLADRSGTVTVVPESRDGCLRVAITDDGCGMPDGFDLSSSRSLGLSIVSTLIAELEGHFELTKNPDGPGTRAVVEIPLVRPATG